VFQQALLHEVRLRYRISGFFNQLLSRTQPTEEFKDAAIKEIFYISDSLQLGISMNNIFFLGRPDKSS